MSFMDQLKKLTQPYDDDEDFFEGADEEYKPKPKPVTDTEAKPRFSAQKLFESRFADDTPLPEEDPTLKDMPQETASAGSIFGNFGKRSAASRPGRRERTMSLGGKDTSVLLFSPKSFDEAGELVNYLTQNLTVVMTLESVDGEMARRLLDFISGIAYALSGRITPVSAKTYFITPQNVDILGVQSQFSGGN